jgi:hypothetical protein
MLQHEAKTWPFKDASAPLHVQDFCTIIRDVPHGSGQFLTCRREALLKLRAIFEERIARQLSRDCRTFQLATVCRCDAKNHGAGPKCQHHCIGQGPVWVCHVTGRVSMLIVISSLFCNLASDRPCYTACGHQDSI